MTAQKPCPDCGEVDHQAFRVALAGVHELDDCNSETYRLILHAYDYTAHLEAQLASLPALVEALEAEQEIHDNAPAIISGDAHYFRHLNEQGERRKRANELRRAALALARGQR